MSRVGLKPVEIPNDVEVNVDGTLVSVKGPKGELSRSIHEDMKVNIDGNVLTVERPSENKKHRSVHGTTRSNIANMIEGVSKGFEKALEIQGVGYRAQLQGQKLVVNAGYSHPVEIEPVEGIDIECPSNTRILVKGIDKELVGAVAANIRAIRTPEPYKGKGIRYENERVRIKEGKTAK
ncbi:50S ribosomal protein L6 [Alkalibacillus haloalkaliphilus]|uniref:Large ribosomal subunit protein uL6 n=1 Tax=Alkalibacillus haloalkaliphilus TaxID=94136 RepID=A0A511W883_9BACI|nr:50S ribosomal protein L6 [Alkalibacillus haloalkaliphilus]MDV2582656.1 50S ribosomal protein L6 [Alkalibacillus haloalkaliphilus]GEN46921.1 50S ribosomal protein L6 [Alkalibacillus haloalkaliphilus]